MAKSKSKSKSKSPSKIKSTSLKSTSKSVKAPGKKAAKASPASAKRAVKKAAKGAQKASSKSPAKKIAATKSQTKASPKTRANAATKSAAKVTGKSIPQTAPQTARKASIKKVTLSPKDLEKILQPLDDRLVVSVAEELERKTAGGLFIPDTVSETAGYFRGQVVAIGRGHMNAKGKVKPMDVEVGDQVLFDRYVGTNVELAGQKVVIVRESEVLGITKA